MPVQEVPVPDSCWYKRGLTFWMPNCHDMEWICIISGADSAACHSLGKWYSGSPIIFFDILFMKDGPYLKMLIILTILELVIWARCSKRQERNRQRALRVFCVV